MQNKKIRVQRRVKKMKKTLKTEAIQMKGGNKTMKKYDKAGNRSHFPTFSLSHLLLSAVITLALCLAGASGAQATLGIELTGAADWPLTNISPGTPHTSDTLGIVWKVKNVGDEAMDVSISAAGSTWTSAGSGKDTFLLEHDAYGSYKNIDEVSLTDNLLAATETDNFSLQFTAPTSESTAKTDTIIVTLTANNQWYSGPIATDVVPNQGINTGSISGVNIIGNNFIDGATIKLKKGVSTIDGTSVAFVSGSSLTANFDLSGAEGGSWTIEVQNPDGDTSPPKDESGTDCFFGVIPDTWSGACIWKEGDELCPPGFSIKYTRTVCTSYGVDTNSGGAFFTVVYGGATTQCAGQGCTCSITYQDCGSSGCNCRNIEGTGSCLISQTYTYCCQ